MSSWPKEDRTDIGIKIILFLLSPILGFIYSLLSMKRKSSYVIFFSTAIIFGLSFTVPSGKSFVSSLDGASYRERFEFFQYLSFSDYLEGLTKFFSFEGVKDYYFDTVAFFISRLTDNYHVMFMVFAIIFAYFSLKSFKFLTSENNFKTSLACFILAYLFMINQIFNINGMRFWTAAWVAVYSILQIFRNGDKKYYLLAFVTPLIHGSYWVFIAVLLIGTFTKRFKKLWVILFFISFFVSAVSVELTQSFTNFLPPVFTEMIESYTNPEYIDSRREAIQESNYAKIFHLLVRVYLNIMVWLFIKNSKLVSNNSKTANLFSFLLVWMTFVNFTTPIPSLGGRFATLSYPLITYIWLVNFSTIKYKYVLYIMPLVFSLSIYQQVLYYSSVLEPAFYYSSPFYLIYKYLIA
jgi:hypothetical protein